MKMVAELGVGRVVVALLIAFAAGVQLSLYLWDVYDDRVADPLSAAIGVLFLLVAAGVGLWPFRRETP